MNIDQYSLVLSIAVLLLGAATLLSATAYVLVGGARALMQQCAYWTYIKCISILALISTIGVLIYQFIYETPVCEYCWWQRIFMFPIEIVSLGSIMLEIKRNEYIIGALASIGTAFAGYHYYYHYQVAVQGHDLTMPCSSIGIVPSCTETSVMVFGFVTIPLMALIAFLSILWLVFLATRARVDGK